MHRPNQVVSLQRPTRTLAYVGIILLTVFAILFQSQPAFAANPPTEPESPEVITSNIYDPANLLGKQRKTVEQNLANWDKQDVHIYVAFPYAVNQPSVYEWAAEALKHAKAPDNAYMLVVMRDPHNHTYAIVPSPKSQLKSDVLHEIGMRYLVDPLNRGEWATAVINAGNAIATVTADPNALPQVANNAKVPEQKTDMTLWIVLGAIAGIALIVLLIWAIVLHRKKKAKRKQAQQKAEALAVVSQAIAPLTDDGEAHHDPEWVSDYISENAESEDAEAKPSAVETVVEEESSEGAPTIAEPPAVGEETAVTAIDETAVIAAAAVADETPAETAEDATSEPLSAAEDTEAADTDAAEDAEADDTDAAEDANPETASRKSERSHRRGLFFRKKRKAQDDESDELSLPSYASRTPLKTRPKFAGVRDEAAIAKLTELEEATASATELAAVAAAPEVASQPHAEEAKDATAGTFDFAAQHVDALEQKQRAEAEERARREAEEQARREAEEQARREAEEQARREAEELALAQRLAEQARREAEEQARREDEEQARREAEEQARREAEEQARREAEEQARREAEEQARREAEEQARREAEEQARREAEEQARREAEEQARREAEEQARREAEEQARREAEELALAQRLAEQARREAEEQARREAEEQARREAEEQARREAEERARREAEEQARREAEEQARREAEEQARREAEELALAQRLAEQARREAEEQARREAEEQARREAEEQARREAEERARREAEEQARREAEEQARREAEEQARREAEEQARREAEEQARQQELLRQQKLRSLLRQTDDLVRLSRYELDLAKRQFGIAATSEFATALVAASNTVQQAFTRLNHADSLSDSEIQTEVEQLQAAKRGLENKFGTYESAATGDDISRAVQTLEPQLAQADRIIGQARGILQRLSLSLPAEMLAQLRDDIADGENSLQRVHAALSDPQQLADPRKLGYTKRALIDGVAAAQRLGDFDAWTRAHQKRKSVELTAAGDPNALLMATMEDVVTRIATVDDFINIRRGKVSIRTRLHLAQAQHLLDRVEQVFDTDPHRALQLLHEAEATAIAAQEDAISDVAQANIVR